MGPRLKAKQRIIKAIMMVIMKIMRNAEHFDTYHIALVTYLGRYIGTYPKYILSNVIILYISHISHIFTLYILSSINAISRQSTV